MLLIRRGLKGILIEKCFHVLLFLVESTRFWSCHFFFLHNCSLFYVKNIALIIRWQERHFRRFRCYCSAVFFCILDASAMDKNCRQQLAYLAHVLYDNYNLKNYIGFADAENVEEEWEAANCRRKPLSDPCIYMAGGLSFLLDQQFNHWKWGWGCVFVVGRPGRQAGRLAIGRADGQSRS